MKITLLYFGRPRENLGVAQETVDTPTPAFTLAELLAWLGARGENWAHELSAQRVRCAVNQTFAALDSRLKTGDEVAIFSPISGG